MRAFLIAAFLCTGLLLSGNASAGTNDVVKGYKRPKICKDTNIRCVLRTLGAKTYWCLKSNMQRNIDTRYKSRTFKKTQRQHLGHCAKTVPADKVEPDK